MKLKEWLEGKPRGTRAQLARSLGVSSTWVCQIAAERKLPSLEVAIAIERLTNGQVARSTLRPDFFGD